MATTSDEPCGGRVRRTKFPEWKSPIRKSQYRTKTLPFLKNDFQCRCAYCMKHLGSDDIMQVDHFDPRRKQDRIQLYRNLFLADPRCNNRKRDLWPSEDAQKAGCRFLDCCQELDYGGCIFENPESHELVGTTPAARYHIKAIDLNAPELIEARKERAEFIAMKKIVGQSAMHDPGVDRALSLMEPHFKNYIPEIPAPPLN